MASINAGGPRTRSVSPNGSSVHQFIRPAFGPIAGQAIVMGTMTAGVQLVVYGLVMLAGRQARIALTTSGPRQILIGRGVAVALAFIAVWSVWHGWRAL